jgi:hypothetical protein
MISQTSVILNELRWITDRENLIDVNRREIFTSYIFVRYP